jgi:hypothetical protein
MSTTPQPSTPARGRAAALLAATAAAAATAAVLLSSASAQDPATRTLSFHELDKGATFIHVRNTRTKYGASNSLGDLIVFTNPIADASGARIGRVNAQCVTTVGSRNFMKSTLTCTGVVHLRDGDLMVQLNTSPGVATSTGAVTGGTGAYANARGVLVSKDTRTGSDDTVSLTG